MRGGPKILDEFLVLECQARNQRALEHLARRWHQRLLYRAMSLVGERDGAQEVAQEAWLAIVKGLSRLQDPARFGSWSYRIVQHKAADWIQRRQHIRGQETDAEPEIAQPPTQSGREDLGVLRAAIARLPNEQRRVIELFYLEENSVREIAELLGVAEGTVKSRLFHARRQLKQSLEDSNAKRQTRHRSAHSRSDERGRSGVLRRLG